MNRFAFSERFVECRKRKFHSQQQFADAYMKKYGMIRSPKAKTDRNMFGTVQSWEQGKSTPTAEVLCNICDLLDCDADYLLGRINQRTHAIEDAHQYTGLSPEALEQLHEYRENLSEYPASEEFNKMEYAEIYHPYYQAFALYLIDEILVGSKAHKLSAGTLNSLYTKIYEDEIAVESDDYKTDEDDDSSDTEEERKKLADECREFVDMACYRITNNIRDILFENAIDNKLPNALKVHYLDKCYYFGIDN